MRNLKRTSGVVAGCAVLMIAGLAFAADWPQWRGPNRDGKVADFAAPQTWPKELTQKWKVAVGAGDATPALVGDKLYVFARQGDEEVILCLEAATGKEVWKDKYAAQAVTGAAARHPGPRSSPAVAEGKVVTLGVGGVVSCLDAATGKVAWRKESAQEGYAAVPRFFTAMSPLIMDGLAVVHLGGQGSGALIAYDLATGDAKWKWTGDAPAYASPALVTVGEAKLIVTPTEKSIVAVSAADGKLAWQAPFAPQGMAYNAPSPIIDGQIIIYTGQDRGTRAVKIEKEGDGFAAKELWHNPETATQFNTPVLKDGLLYGLSAGAGRRSGGGKFFCINAKTGATAWTDETGRGTTFAALVDAGSAIIALTSDSQMTVFQPGDKAYTEVASIKVSEKQTYAHPVIADKRVFVRDEDSVTLWTLE